MKPANQVDLSGYRNRHSRRNKLARASWAVAHRLLFRYTPVAMHGWRINLLRLFGARIGKHCAVLPSCRVWAPWNMVLGDYVCLAEEVEFYNVAPIRIGSHATVSQQAFLCTASHDTASASMELTIAPIEIGSQAWVAARAFIGPGRRLGDGAVAGACSVVMRNVPEWTIVAGNPAEVVRKRDITRA